MFRVADHMGGSDRRAAWADFDPLRDDPETVPPDLFLRLGRVIQGRVSFGTLVSLRGETPHNLRM